MGLKEVLYRLIENTPHSDESLTVEQRYDNVMKALMGDYYYIDKISKPPHNVSTEQVIGIVANKGKEKSLNDLIRDEINKDSKNVNEEAKNARFEALRKYLQRHIVKYLAFFDSSIEHYERDLEWENYIKSKIIKTLKEAEWF